MRKVVQTILFTGLTLLAFVAVAGQVADKTSYEKIYKKQCGACHGNKGDGKGRAAASFASQPTNFTSLGSRRSLTAEQIKIAIRDGVAGTSMVAYGRRFDEETISGLTDYIQTVFMRRNVASDNRVEARSADVPKSTLPQQTSGQTIYNENCSACHGDGGASAVWAKNGLTPPPRNFTTAQARQELSRERMLASVTHGRPGTAMMAFSTRLSTTEIEAVVDYIRDNFMQQKAASLSPIMPPVEQKNLPSASNAQNQLHEISVDMQAAFTGNIIGNALSGKRFYESNCFVCHGMKGDGAGPRADFNYPRPRDFTSQDSRLIFNRPRLFDSISHGKRGSVMPAWNTVLSVQKIANVAEYVFQQFILDNDAVALKKKLKE